MVAGIWGVYLYNRSTFRHERELSSHLNRETSMFLEYCVHNFLTLYFVFQVNSHVSEPLKLSALMQNRYSQQFPNSLKNTSSATLPVPNCYAWSKQQFGSKMFESWLGRGKTYFFFPSIAKIGHFVERFCEKCIPTKFLSYWLGRSNKVQSNWLGSISCSTAESVFFCAHRLWRILRWT